MIPTLLQSAIVALLLQSALQIPTPVGVVSDFAHVIPADEAAKIEQIAGDVRAKSRGEISVVTMADIGDRAVADVALEIGRQWKVGKIGNPGDPTRNAGAVILLVPKETSSDGRGHCYVATGNGAEGFITDADAGAICRQATPLFMQRDYGHGIELVTYLTAARFAKEFNFTIDTAIAAPQAEPVSSGGRSSGFPPQLIFLALIFIVVMISNLGRRRRGCGGCLPLFIPWGGLGGGGFGGGGGGFSGGGGGGFGGFGGGGGFSGGGGGSSW